MAQEDALVYAYVLDGNGGGKAAQASKIGCFIFTPTIVITSEIYQISLFSVFFNFKRRTQTNINTEFSVDG